MATCNNCGRQLPENAKICMYCGKPADTEDLPGPSRTEKERTGGTLLIIALIVLFAVFGVVAVTLGRQYVPLVREKMEDWKQARGTHTQQAQENPSGEEEIYVNESNEGKLVVSQSNGADVFRTSDFTCTGYRLHSYDDHYDYYLIIENTSSRYIDVKADAVYYSDQKRRGSDEAWGCSIAPGGKRLMELYPEKATTSAELTFELEYFDESYVRDEYVGYEVEHQDEYQVDIKFVNNLDEMVSVYLAVLFFRGDELVSAGFNYCDLGEASGSSAEQTISVFCDGSFDSCEILYDAL